jgi:hypothetical protein
MAKLPGNLPGRVVLRGVCTCWFGILGFVGREWVLQAAGAAQETAVTTAAAAGLAPQPIVVGN